MVQTEIAFTLPCGYIDEQGTLHRQGVMRRATALDEVEALGDQRVRNNPAYMSILVLSRVITRLGTISTITPNVVSQFFAADFAYLQDLYVQLNDTDASLIATQCPGCGTRFVVDLLNQDGAV